MDIIIGIFIQGFLYAIMALGVYITYRILDFPDLTVDGSFPLGAAITAVMLINGYNGWLCLLVALLGGAVAGLFTGLIHVKLGVRDLLSGIIMMTALYSVNYHIAGKSNVPLFNENTIFSSLQNASGLSVNAVTLLLAAVLALLVKLILDWYLRTGSGFLLRCCGDNPSLICQLGKDAGRVKIVGLVLANSLAALSGAVVCQQQRYFDITMGTGTIIIGLAAVIIGINALRRISFLKMTTKVIIGAVLYKACVAGAIAAGLDPMNMRLITAVLFLLVLVISSRMGKGGAADVRT